MKRKNDFENPALIAAAVLFEDIAFLPEWLRNISAFNPIRYSIDGLRQALFYPGLEGLPLDITVLTGTALISVSLGAFAVRRLWNS